MAKPWSEVAASDGFKALPPDQQDGARRQYFDDVVAPRVPPEHVDIAWDQFATDTGVGKRVLPEGVKPSLAGAGRGSVNPPTERPISLADARPSIPTAPLDTPPSDPMGSGFAETISAAQPKRESVLEGVQFKDPQLDPELNRQTMLRSASPDSVMFNAGRAKQTADELVSKGARLEELARKGKFDSIPDMLEAQVDSDRRKAFARENPNVSAVASGAANMVKGSINAPSALAGFLNKTFVDPVLGVAGAGPMPNAPIAPGTDSLNAMASDFMPEVAKLPMGKAWDSGVFGEWLAANVSAQVPQMTGQIAGVISPAMRAAILPTMGAQAAGGSFAEGDDPRVAVAKGVLEVLSEGASFGVADKIKDALVRLPSSAQQSLFANIAKRSLAMGGAVTGQMLAGAVEETVAQIGGNALDIYASGKNKSLMDKVDESAVIGAFSSAGMSLPNVVEAARDNSPQAQAARALSQQLNGGQFSPLRPQSGQTPAPTPSAEQMMRDRGFLSYKPDTLRPTERHKEIISSVDDIAVAQGIPPKAVTAAKDRADTLPLAERPGFFKRFFGAYGRGRGTPLADAALVPLDEHDAALHQPEDAPPINDVLALEGEQNAPESPANIDSPAIENIAPEWQSFPPESGTLGVPRAEMPQIQSVHRGALVNYLKARGVEAVQGEIQADQLKPTQAEFSPAKVERAQNFEGDDRSILISSDGHILDGHHQWLAKLQGNQTVKAIQLNAPISELVPLVNSFPSSYKDEASQAPEAAPIDPSPAEVSQAPKVQPAAGGMAPEVDATQPGDSALISRGEVASPLEVKPEMVSGSDRIGKNNTPLSEGGKPFKTNKAAREAKKQQPMMRVVKVDGGYALAPKTEAQIAAQQAAARRLAVPRMGQPGVPLAAHEFIAGEGGIDPSHKGEFSVGNNPRVGNRRLFAGKRGGLSLEDATQKLIEAGYLQEGASHSDAINLIGRSLTNPQYTPEGVERMAEADQNQQFEDHLAAQQEAAQNEDFDPFESLDDMGFELDDAELSGYDEASDPIKLEVAALVEQANGLGIDTESLLETAAQATQNESEQAYYEYAKQSIQDAIAKSSGSRSNDADQGQDSQQGRQDADAGSSGNRSQDSGAKGDAGSQEELAPDKPTKSPPAAPSPEGVSVSDFTLELSPTGTLRIKGDQTAIRAKLREGGVTRITPMTGGVVVGKTEALKAKAILENGKESASKPDSAQDSSAQSKPDALKSPDAQDSQQSVRDEALIELRKRMSVLKALKTCLGA